MGQKEEAERLLKQTEQQVSILKASLDRATKAKEHAEAQVCATAVTPCFSRFVVSVVFEVFGDDGDGEGAMTARVCCGLCADKPVVIMESE